MRNTAGLRKGGGRPKGAQNKTTREIKDFAVKFLTSKEYIDSAKCRVLSGDAPHLETLWHHYAFGKPKESVTLDSNVPAFVLRLDAGDQ